MPFGKSGFQLAAYRLAPENVPDVLSFRKTAVERKLDTLALGVDVPVCRMRGSDGVALVTTFLRTEAGKPYLILTREEDIEAASDQGSGPARIPTC